MKQSGAIYVLLVLPPLTPSYMNCNKIFWDLFLTPKDEIELTFCLIYYQWGQSCK